VKNGFNNEGAKTQSFDETAMNNFYFAPARLCC